MTKIERDRSILLKLKIICSEKNGIFYAEIIDIPGCKVKGNSLEELKRNISKKIKMWFDLYPDSAIFFQDNSTEQQFSPESIRWTWYSKYKLIN